MFQQFEYENDSFHIFCTPKSNGKIHIHMRDKSGKRRDLIEDAECEAHMILALCAMLVPCADAGTGEVKLPG